jgi:uncharacterized protein (TIGR02996 family)
MARNLSLEAAIASSGDVGTYEVYADWLIEHGDPRGDLITLDIACERDPDNTRLKDQRNALLGAHADPWLGALAGRPEVECVWHRGFLHAVTIGQTDDTRHATAYAALRGLPTAALLRELTLWEHWSDEPWLQPAVEALAEHGISESLRSLAFGASHRHQHWGTAKLDSLAILYPHLGGLDALRVRANELDLGDIKLPAIRVFEVASDGFTRANLASLIGASWPRLEDLALRFEATGVHARDLARLLDALPASLRSLRVDLRSNDPDVQSVFDDFMTELAQSAVLRRLTTLDLSGSEFDDDEAHRMLRATAPFAHLGCLDVSETNVSLAMLRRLRDVFSQVVASWSGRGF